ncbi:MAG: ABC transporter ATP-binding protein [Neisseriaceae bacterium]|nr:ABC transporter ATP-binding protein [Neisseriaceae bacterium]
MTTPFIEFQNISFAYGERPIISDINFAIHKGESVAIMGGSGCGKTTLLRLITRQLEPNSGRILINGKELAAFSRDELYEYRRSMGVLFQFGALFTDLSVYDNVAFPLREHTQLPESVIRDLVLLKLDAVGLRGTQDLMPSELSGGMSRRVALARTIALDPALMLYDEPFTGLDPISLGVTAHLIARLTKALHATGIMVTHDIGASLSLVDRILFMAQGKIIFSGSPKDMQNTDEEWVQQFINGKPHGPVEYRYPAKTSLKDDLVEAA